MRTSSESYGRERLGRVVGRLSAPLFGAVALARRARVFHPEGIVLAARVEPIFDAPALRDITARLAGPALVRFSTALWRKGREWPDALGCAIRFRDRDEPSASAEERDQDLLFATIRTPIATPIGPLGTRVHDFLANTYFATAPFDVEGLGRAKWRLVSEHASPAHGTRAARLLAAITGGEATLRLELRRTWRARYVPVARVVLLRAVCVDQDALRFSPFRAGRGVVPRGFVHALRRGAYAASQRLGHPAAPTREEEHARQESDTFGT